MPHSYLITGANRGIGLELARQLKGRGETVIGTARDTEDAVELKAVADRTEKLEITSEVSLERLASKLEHTAIDCLIHNAAVGPRSGPAESLDFDELLRDFEVNAVGAMRVAAAFLPSVRMGSLKKIVFITSQMGSIGAQASGDHYGYRASKAALNMLGRCLSVELRPEEVTVLLVHPGWVRTRMGGQQASLSPEESVAGMLGVIDGAGLGASGQFLTHEGEELPW